MNRRKFLKRSFVMASMPILGWSAFNASCSLSNSSTNLTLNNNKPNFVFILADDLGWKDSGYMGSSYYETPNIDKLASEGMVFTNAYANAANCAPSRACLLTGQYPPRHGMYTVGTSERGVSSDRRLIPVANDTTLNAEHLTFAEALKPAGYVSISIGKWHVGSPSEGLGPEGQGFDINIAGSMVGWPNDTPGGQYIPGGYSPPYHYYNCLEPKGGRFLTERLTDDAIEFIENNQKNPFFLYLPHYAVHLPLEAKDEHEAYYKSSEKIADRTTRPDHDNATYAAMIHSVDESVGRIMKKIEELGLDENTVFFFFSDNGGVGGITDMYPLRGSKGMPYEGGIREPLIVRWKGTVLPGTVCNVAVIGIDFFPTFLELAGVKKPSGVFFDGLSIAPLLFGGETLSRDAIFWHFPAYLERYDYPDAMQGARKDYPEQMEDEIPFRSRPVSVIRKDNWKLLLFLEEWILDCKENTSSPKINTAVELYDLESDIGETKNQAAINTAKRDELLTDLLNWRQSLGISIGEMTPNPYYGQKH